VTVSRAESIRTVPSTNKLRAAAEAQWKDRVRAADERKRRAAEERERERVAK
jgi:hypothetical protein